MPNCMHVYIYREREKAGNAKFLRAEGFPKLFFVKLVQGVIGPGSTGHWIVTGHNLGNHLDLKDPLTP